ncbi:pyrroline-5-carboxylate reductase [Microbulbifer thermotolerans]|uniref:pyrroline-5-carboxylate reductase n=1 Tax=Microbulbifer thermotolerans TaxID=252514 RepID=UPI0022493B85|nr:pyrroline-5-carboxylate reductase [Microbulbifer thermotolerans]MCX2779085.1 pyrroline-5-carboxylate reductase [Microbulbifer thermotolerans]MCX2782729.1 pyrroline-5-carboxylate reductase [Microbulbifer thermotolerans]MCX2795617.1 pyrroline-5-carboxylate reductase [Microbulbifer thermotolerans]MCX2805283.1 pyrroline-5-carboxylate reductase [Microbulbifer thermotolerans]MCX2831798.1 pyrroline-5-carboxylate reductase [Microbulbifer thermotolerans]
MTEPKMVFIGGAGNMAGAVIEGLLGSGYPAERIIATGVNERKLADFSARTGVRVTTDNSAAVAEADVLVLSVKPQVMKDVCLSVAEAVSARAPLVITLAAGIPLAAYRRWLGTGVPLVRAMPNTPALVGTGVTGLYAAEDVSAEQRRIAEQLAEAVGIAHWVDDESGIDQVIAVSGSGPAYYFQFMESMIDAAEKAGMRREDAERLTLQTALGAAKLAVASDVDVAQLKRNVMSPKGTTERAIQRFLNGGLPDLVERAMGDCAARAAEMAKELDN